MIIYFYRVSKNSVHKPTDNGSNNLFKRKNVSELFNLASLFNSYLSS
jgi:hypothetical protein